MLLQLVVAIVVLFCVLATWKPRNKILFANKFKCDIKTVPILGHAYLFLMNRNDKDRWKIFKMLNNEAQKQRGAFCLWNVNKLYFFVAHPAIAECVMKNCLEKDDALKLVMAPIKNGTLVANVAMWHPRRKAVGSTFSYNNLKEYGKVFSKQSMILMTQLQKVSSSDSICLFKYLTSYAMDALSETTLGVELNTQENNNHTIRKAVAASIQLVFKRSITPWMYYTPIFMLTANSRQIKEHVRTVFSFVQTVITNIRDKLATNNDINNDKEKGGLNSFLKQMIKSTSYDDITLKKEVVVLFIAGSEVMSTATSFISVLLARYPHVQEKIYNELRDVFGDSKRPVTQDDLIELKYLEAVIKEGLRLYPPGPFLLRKSHHDVVLPSGAVLPKNTTVIISVYGIHRHPTYWGDDVEEFRPERFIDAAPKHPAAFMAFSTGPRNCVGHTYAMLSMKTVLATLLRHYRILPNCKEELGQPIDVKYDFALRAADGFKVVLEPRG